MNPLQKTHLTIGIVILASLALYALTQTWYPLILPALIGAGLIRAGITGTCPMTNWWARTCKTDRVDTDRTHA